MNSDQFIYHMTSQAMWDAAQSAGFYRGDTLETEGFIHCSRAEQIPGTAQRFFCGRSGLVMLKIQADLVRPEVRYEGQPGGPLFPHIYGPLNLNAVVSTTPVHVTEQGELIGWEPEK